MVQGRPILTYDESVADFYNRNADIYSKMYWDEMESIEKLRFV